MWSGMCFEREKEAAANVPYEGERGTYTAEMFAEDFSQFSRNLKEDDKGMRESLVPISMLDMFLFQANDSVIPSRWGSLWRYAAGLYVAHFSAMYLKTYTDSSVNAAQAAVRANPTGVIRTAVMGDTSVSYDNSAITSGIEKWGAWNSTQYGQQLVTLARMVGMGGMYVI